MKKWINTAENLLLTLISFTAGVLLGAYVTFSITDKVIESNQVLLIEAIQKSSSTINNEYDIKNKKGTLKLTPENLILIDSFENKKNRRNGWKIFKK